VWSLVRHVSVRFPDLATWALHLRISEYDSSPSSSPLTAASPCMLVHQCYNSPRKFGQPCSLGYYCDSGLSCQRKGRKNALPLSLPQPAAISLSLGQAATLASS